MKRLKVGLLSAVTALGVFGFGASSAQAVPVPVTLDNGFLKIGGIAAPIDVVTPADPVVVTLDVDLATGAFTAQPADFDFTPFLGTQGPINLSVDLALAQPLSGSLNPATGAVTTAVTNYTAQINLSGGVTATCSVGPIPLDLSTEFPGPPFLGDRFDPGIGLPANGALADGWATLPAATGTGCSLVDALSGGPGGLWLANGLAAPATPSAGGTAGVAAPAKKCKKAKKKKGKKAAAAKKCKKKKKKKK